MKIDLKLVLLWITSLVFFAGAGVVALTAPDWMSGIQGLTIRFFLGYCGVIVVAQVFALMEVIRRLQEELSASNSRYHSGIELTGHPGIQ